MTIFSGVISLFAGNLRARNARSTSQARGYGYLPKAKLEQRIASGTTSLPELLVQVSELPKRDAISSVKRPARANREFFAARFVHPVVPMSRDLWSFLRGFPLCANVFSLMDSTPATYSTRLYAADCMKGTWRRYRPCVAIRARVSSLPISGGNR